MSEPQSDADKIRNKRLAKLGGARSSPSGSSQSTAPQSSSPPATASSSPTSLNASNPAQQPNGTPEETTAASLNPFDQLGIKPTPQPQASAKPQINITPLKREGEENVRPGYRSGKREETLEEWEDRILRGIFGVTLKDDQAGERVLYLAGYVADQDEAGVSPARLSVGSLDSAIIEAASGVPKKKPLDYLLGCWKRAVRQGKLLRNNPNTAPKKFEIIKEARRLIMSYSIFAVTDPDMFGAEQTTTSVLADHLLADPECDHGVCYDFIQEALSRLPDDESGRDMLVDALLESSRRLSKISMAGDYHSYIVALRNLTIHTPIAEAVAQTDFFLPSGLQPQDIETSTFLGPFFRLSPLQAEVANRDFLGTTGQPENIVHNVQNSQRIALKTHQDELFDVVNVMIKGSKTTRERILDWFALVVNSNHKRRALQVDWASVSSDGFMVNITTVLDRLCEPFMDATFSKVHRIEVEYLRRSPRVNIKDETKINADQSASDEFYSQQVEGTSNFISEVFFLTVAAHHYGTEAANTQLSNKERSVRQFEKEIARMEAERPKFIHQPGQLARFDTALKKYKDKLEESKCEIKATQGILLDETAQTRSMQLMRYVIVWILRLVSPKNIPAENPDLPLPEAEPQVFKCLPEYFIEDIVDNFKFVTRHMPWVITPMQCQEIVMMCIVFLRSGEYIKNPYLKSGLVTILFHGVWPIRNKPKGVLGDQLNGSEFAVKHLLHALMKFFIEAEHTGAHTQFYDKFNIRYEIFQVIRCIWANTVYQDNLAREARLNTEFFVQFVNLLMNDVTFVLDESFNTFKQIRDLEIELKRPDPSWTQEQRQEKEEALANAKGKSKSYIGLANETLSMLKLFTEALADSFTRSEIVQRLADMLDYNLDTLVGTRQSDLKVENKEEYKWRPQDMLSDIMEVFLNLRKKENFQLAIARDGRSYKPDNFPRAARVMERFTLKSPEQLAHWFELAEVVAKVREEDLLAEEDLGEIPDEFTDPLLATLMEDPVILPSSRSVMDRSTVRSHLLSDPHDPFNRQPLKLEDVIPATELKGRIEAFKKERKEAKAAERKAAMVATDNKGGGEPMDTS